MSDKKKKPKVKIPFKQAAGMLYPYAKIRVMDQLKSVSIIVVYLILFQILVLQIPIQTASIIAVGISLVILGLAFFMEGLVLGLMPLGEICGVKLPQKTNLFFILIFAFILGIGATLAEPAIGVLKAAGSSVKAWDAPLLFLLLNKYTTLLVASVGIGVGIAVLFGMLRFIYKWSLKPFIYLIIPLLLGLSAWGLFDKNILYVTGLAWDCGGVTTGPVTVPLILALGIGVSRIIGGKSSDAGSGFGVVTLASAFPILTVLMLGFFFMNAVPSPMKEADFFKAENRQKAAMLFNNEEHLTAYAVKTASPETIRTLFDNDPQKILQYMKRIDRDKNSQKLYFTDSSGFYRTMFSKIDRSVLADFFGSEEELKRQIGLLDSRNMSQLDVPQLLKANLRAALQAILPLCLFLIIILVVFLQEKLPHTDEAMLGILFAVFGMMLFSIGIELGLSRLGNQVGAMLPSTVQSIELSDQKTVIPGFEEEIIYTSVNNSGEKSKFFFTKTGPAGRIIPLPFEEKYYDKDTGRYIYVPKKGPLFNFVAGIIVVLLFSFAMGYGATLAEPALNALGATVEELTVGTFKKSLLMQSVAIGVGIGISFGIAKIIWDFPLIWLLGPPYLLLLFITKISSDTFVNIGWDSAGVTTGPITVPLVLAMGLGLSNQFGVVEGFGILASASVFPILSVLSVGLFVNYRRNKLLKEA